MALVLQPGIHERVPMLTYLDQCAPGPCVQGTDLKRMIERCPAWAFARWSGNPDAIEEPDTEATAFGRAAHTYLLEGAQKFHRIYAIKPAGLNLTTKEGRAWKEQHTDAERIDEEDFDAIVDMQQAIGRHEWASAALSNGKPEVTAIVQDKETGLFLKCRPDWLTDRLAVNLKTAKDNGADAFRRQSWKLKYHLSAALTEDILKALGEPRTVALLPVEKSAPYIPVLRAPSERHMLAGRLLYRRALRRWADCLSSGKWPGYADDRVEQMESAPWEDREIDALIEQDNVEKTERKAA